MPTPRRNAVFIFAWILFWALMIMVAVQDFERNEHSRALWKPVLWEGSSALVATVLALVQIGRSHVDDHLLATPRRWFLRQARWLPLYWIAFIPLAFGLRHGVYALMGQTYHHDALPQLWLYESMKISIFVGLFTAIQFGIKSYRALLEQKLRAERATALMRQAQLLRLSQQMQPHFLFNALNTVSALMYTDVARADATLTQLADMLRATLDAGERHAAPLAAELRLARSYADVMAERFAGRVRIAWHVDDSLLGEDVPVMSLQPLLENVFKHTVERRRGLTRIDVSARRDGAVMVLGVADDAGRLAPLDPAPLDPAPVDPARTDGGIGLANLRARLAALYGERATLAVFGQPDGGVCAELRLPCAS
jgi:two-component system LytT family sensor kinase